ncbi:MAG: TIGR01212 family radical SAM protein [Chromatiales bacterium]|nr:TIGR01212 family radical SAM protein [Chromatiales bacterium]
MAEKTPCYFPISAYYRRLFGEKVYKVSVSIAESCPNRQPNGKLLPCVFCDEWGSAAYHLERDRDLVEQIQINRDKIARRYRSKKFLVYFQSYTNTFDRVERLSERFDIALAQEGICGLVVGTRPDCLPARVMPLLRETHERSYVMVELGVQSFFDPHLLFLQRGHDAQRSLTAVERLHQEAGVDIGVHLIFGLPGETDAQIVETAEIINSLPVSNVKLHNLHVLKNTPLETLYQRGEFKPLELDEYSRRVVLFLQHLSPEVAVQRLAAVASRWDELVAPEWTREKLRPSNMIEQRLHNSGFCQGDRLAIAS